MVRHDEASPWRYPPNCEFLYDERLRTEYERGLVPEPGPMPDLAPLITMVRRGATSLHGPPPAALPAPVPHADLRRAITEGVPELPADLGPALVRARAGYPGQETAAPSGAAARACADALVRGLRAVAGQPS
ncbi:hypothetical protein [Streptomyces sp. NPDC059861]|uniref:hypothetical protein n=1 Tax=Streptomyces sp. NPDC059861 TaxID=3346974 RepID=UPI003666128E